MTLPETPSLGLTARQIGWRLFWTCWIVYSLHMATDIVREHYPAVALGDRFSFDLQDFCGLHPDLFETPGRGCHIGNNPGASMLAAIPYAIARPAIDVVVRRALAAREGREPPEFRTPWPNARRFYETAWHRGLDIKLGLGALVMNVFAMAPSSAFGVVMVFLVLRALFKSDRLALWLALAYAFATPVFFRTGFLNHNLMLGHFAFAGFALLWNPWHGNRVSARTREILCGVGAGTALLFDYSGAVICLVLGVYVMALRWREGGPRAAFLSGVWYTIGALGPILLLWFYQWKAFGNPFLPGQHWMPPVAYIDRGYQGYQFPPDAGLLLTLLADHRFGLFTAAPLLLLAVAYPFVDRGIVRRIPWLEAAILLGMGAALWIFFAGNNYTRLQFNTGIRYLAPVFPFLFVPAAVVLVRLKPALAFAFVLLGLLVSWPLAMYREVEVPLGLLDPIVRTFSAGFSLPVLHFLSLTSGQYGDYFSRGTSPLPAFALAALVIWALWSPRFRRGVSQ